MRIGFISPLKEDDFRFAAEHGFPCMETNITHDTQPLRQRRDELKRLMRDYRVGLSHIGLYDNDHTSADAETRQACARRVRDIVDLCQDLAIPVFTTGGGYGTKGDVGKSCKDTVEVLGGAVDYAAGKGVRFAFYNCHWGNHVVGPGQWEPIFDALPEAGIKFDPSHPFAAGQDYLQEMLDWGPKFLHVHAKGCIKVGGKHIEDPPPGLDQVDWATYFALLYRHDYNADINIEPHSKTWSGPRTRQGVLLAQRFLKQYLLG